MTREYTDADREKAKAAYHAYRKMLNEEHARWVSGGCPQPDMAALVLWVWASLAVDKPQGSPGPMARSLLAWARTNRKEFFTLFVAKLVPGKGKADQPPEPDHAADEAILKRLRGEG